MRSCTSTFRSSVSLAGLALALYACVPHGTDEAARYRPAPGIQALEQVDFAALRTHVLTPYCVSCHADMETEAGTAAYVTPGAPLSSSLYTTILDGSMPPGGPTLAPSLADLVSTYILNQKAQEAAVQ